MKHQRRRFHEFLIIAVLLPGVPVILGSCGDGGGGGGFYFPLSFDVKSSFDSPTSVAMGDLDGVLLCKGLDEHEPNIVPCSMKGMARVP